jgi:carboxypeptidase Taq
MALEESQSLLLEMIVGRSRPFVRFLRPLLEKHFGVSGPEWDEDNLYRRLTRVSRSPVRVDADELTYPLHVMLRFDLEKRLLAGQLAVRHLPEAWNEGMESRLGIRPANDVEGVLQDIHWALGSFACFPWYAVGAAIAAQLGEGLRRDVPALDEQIAAGDFTGLFGWLRQHVHGYGAKLNAQDLMRQATGRPIGAQSALRYLEAKYLEQPPAASAAA